MYVVEIHSKISAYSHVVVFSKIADLQARSAALGAALRACRSAVFQQIKHKITVEVDKRYGDKMRF